MDFLWWLASSIEGKLWNPITGSPVRKADVVVGTLTGQPVKRAISDANGHYLVDGLPAGEYRVAAGRTGFLPSLLDTVITLGVDEIRKGVDIGMESPAVISGHVFDAEGEPLEGISVSAVLQAEPSGIVQIKATARTDDTGEYRLAGLVAGTYRIHTSRAPAPLDELYTPAFYPDAADWDRATPVRVALGGEARDIDIRITKSKPGSISGVVRGAGSVRVTASRKSVDSVMLALKEAEVTSAPDGRFLIPMLPPGNYVVTASAGQLRGSANVSVDAAESQVVLTLK